MPSPGSRNPFFVRSLFPTCLIKNYPKKFKLEVAIPSSSGLCFSLFDQTPKPPGRIEYMSQSLIHQVSVSYLLLLDSTGGGVVYVAIPSSSGLYFQPSLSEARIRYAPPKPKITTCKNLLENYRNNLQIVSHPPHLNFLIYLINLLPKASMSLP